MVSVAEPVVLAAPELPYLPPNPRRYSPPIGMIGCGNITERHLTAYQKAGYNIAAFCDINEAAAQKRRQQFYPDARVYTDYDDLLAQDDIEVVDVTTHPHIRPAIIEASLNAGKHVLSQKPFVLDLNEGKRLADLADSKGVLLAINQNGRWAPHFSYIRQAVERGLLGKVFAVHMNVHWDHSWIIHTAFNEVPHIILYDFAIHWFDIVTCFLPGEEPKRVFASLTRAPGQTAKPPLLGQAMIEFDNAQATMVFDGCVRLGARDRTFVGGTEGTILSYGPDFTKQTVTLFTPQGQLSPTLHGSWFPDGFRGTMGELLCAIEEKRQPTNNAHENLRGLALCFAAVQSAETGQPQVPGLVYRITT
jgi:predicted dehydrogenase